MKVSINWLKELVEFKLSNSDLDRELSMRGLEIEKIHEEDNDSVLEIELTPNRGDCASVIGVARELAAISETTVKYPEVSYKEEGELIEKEYTLDVKNSKKCPIYYLKLIRSVKIGESPEWIKERLIQSGIRPLNNIIDISNYVLLETGQPLHAFDAAKITGNKIIVRDGLKNEKFQTLDEIERNLSKEDIIIADKDKAIALGGVMGGVNSAVSDSTVDILLEGAFFVPEYISKTSRRLELQTEASYRFARHVDASNIKNAVERATMLYSEICGGKPAPGILEFNKYDLSTRQIELDYNEVNSFLGTNISGNKIKSYLEILGFKLVEESNKNLYEVPPFRNDVSRPIDLIEEVARMHGYENINLTFPVSEMSSDLLKEADIFSSVSDILRQNSYWEAITHTLVDEKNIIEFSDDNIESRLIRIDNPINRNMNVLRTNLVFGLIDVLKYNHNQKNSGLRFYERGPVFVKEISDTNQADQIGIVSAEDDYFGIKKVIISIFKEMKQKYEIDYNYSDILFDSDYCSAVKLNGIPVAVFGKLNKNIIKNYSLSGLQLSGAYVDIWRLDIDSIKSHKYTKWSPFPSVLRDISLISPANLTHNDICSRIRLKGGKTLKKIKLYDIYYDEKLGKNKKSYTYNLEFNSDEKTLTSEEIDVIIGDIVKDLEKSLEITLRPDQ